MSEHSFSIVFKIYVGGTMAFLFAIASAIEGHWSGFINGIVAGALWTAAIWESTLIEHQVKDQIKLVERRLRT